MTWFDLQAQKRSWPIVPSARKRLRGWSYGCALVVGLRRAIADPFDDMEAAL